MSNTPVDNNSFGAVLAADFAQTANLFNQAQQLIPAATTTPPVLPPAPANNAMPTNEKIFIAIGAAALIFLVWRKAKK